MQHYGKNWKFNGGRERVLSALNQAKIVLPMQLGIYIADFVVVVTFSYNKWTFPYNSFLLGMLQS